MYKGYVKIPIDSNGKQIAHRVDADGYHQSVRDHCDPTFMAMWHIAMPAGSNTLFAMLNSNATKLIEVVKMTVTSWPSAHATGVQHAFSYGRLTGYTGGTALGAPAPMDTQDAWPGSVAAVYGPTAMAGAAQLGLFNTWEKVLASIAEAGIELQKHQHNMFPDYKHCKRLLLRQNQGIYIADNLGLQATGALVVSAVFTVLDNS